ncbi:conserved hypothetical protein [Candidatus Competibacter denitrificans Run_A_D11]|jgi:Smg protein|uniref:Protein Smg homolog n=1 Tax=Candidatus Competibacter denitrificans Run_A_D11 TaxID=1400863 RepID=W6M353_9GAMM|nr:DUF494 domain-containing protein [Candidatus Competibacter denitrificans]CDI00924.1 conserved hypothetical protein [Candidatus Competibacter denitrificans Run_A_D11]HAS86687.1 DUF494 domain-containing protein [Candidatus Competibacteraceae bacterium]HRC70051.1 DUF494 domain-containing protein [Candidatus Competibacter denitrificans]
MKENVLDVLIYLFQSYMDDHVDPDPDRESIQSELVAAGFASREVRQAFEWLDSLTARPGTLAVNPSSYRIYVGPELAKLDVECRGFLLSLEQGGILGSETRELVIDRVMALEADDIGLQQLKWIILMVLFNQPGQEEAYACLEDMVFDEIPGYLH